MIRTVRQSIGLFALTAGIAIAAAPSLEWQWPIDGGNGVLQVELDESVYRHIQRDDLGDLMALDADGQPIPMGPLSQVWTPPSIRELPMQPVPLFRLPAKTGDTGGDAVELHIRRDDDGRLSALDASVTPGSGDGGAASDILLDLSALKASYDALQLHLDLPDDASFDARLQIDGSDDLSHWRAVGGDHALLYLKQNGFELVRDRVSLPRVSHDYLRLHRADGGSLPVDMIEVRTLPAVEVTPPQPRSLRLSGEAMDDEAGAFVYRSPGPFPVSRLDLETSGDNAISAVIISSRSDDKQAWRERGRFTLFDLEQSGARLHNDTLMLRGDSRDRLWRVQTKPALRTAPMLRLDYVPDRFVMLTQGPAPYRLAAGSATAVRENYPLPALLSEIRRNSDADWRPPLAKLGEGSALAGNAALEAPSKPLPTRQIVLWVILIGAAFLLLLLVGRLLKQPPEGGD